jgi:glutathione S-transferase
MGKLIFYTNPWSRGQIARFMLEEVGAPYEQVLLDYAGQMKAPDYLAINPMEKVPAIVHDGRVVTECAAICAYLADAFPDAATAPPPTERAAYYRCLFLAAGPMEQAMMDRHRGFTPEGEQQTMSGYGEWGRLLDTLEQVVTRHSWLAGERFSAADVYLGSQLDWGVGFGMVEARPAFAAYLDRLRARPAYARAKAIDAALAEQANGDAAG